MTDGFTNTFQRKISPVPALRPLATIDIRMELARKLEDREFVTVNRESTMTAITGSKMIEIIGATFVVTDQFLFGDTNWDYVAREEEWYHSQSLSVNDFPGGAPTIWKAVADKDGFINSNYGWCIFSEENGNQFNHAFEELALNPASRRAQMIYNRPSMHKDFNKNGRSDFMCTDAVQYFIRDGKLVAHVRMRSNDAVFGFKNDVQWQLHVQKLLADQLNVEVGDLIWTAGSLHVYERHFYLVDFYTQQIIADGNGPIRWSIPKEEYKQLFPNSEFA